ncbi:hypothetical protein L198_03552 [Cryptococcus wingfieldii CBS 7118]|uniref:Uncharacterized protein n=1 Tax=Cryptococcus wingfieldii CBS 7118 TaxID=1295528 RepID=A0A1E3JBQ1_9TREE|nr:hypothetical protein L198_03552 [Cryptococcus wingfieldii CBS 7118]ODN98308.1 hypothetical protein L198_03552 [Cryptococcus wingfieldii CBS 7118]
MADAYLKSPAAASTLGGHARCPGPPSPNWTPFYLISIFKAKQCTPADNGHPHTPLFPHLDCPPDSPNTSLQHFPLLIYRSCLPSTLTHEEAGGFFSSVEVVKPDGTSPMSLIPR